MALNKILCFLFLVGLITATPFTQDDVALFVQQNNLVPPTSTISTFTTAQDKSIITYKDDISTFKLVIGKNPQGKPFVIFRQQMTEIKFSNLQNNQMIIGGNAPFINPTPIDIPMPMPMPMIQMPMPMMPLNHERFNPQVLSGGMITNFPGRHGMSPLRRKRFGGQMPCRINKGQVQALLKQNLVIFKNAEIKQISKVGFERGNGILLQITLTNDKKDFKVTAGYMPRWNTLNVKKVQEIETPKIQLNQNSKEQNKVIQIPQIPVNPENQQSFNFESLIQSFVQKLLVRKNTDNKQQEQKSAAPLLLGSQNEPENPFKFETPQVKTPEEKPLLVVQDLNEKKVDEPKKEKIEQKVNDHHKEANSEQISQLVSQVISKIKLRSK